MSILGNFYEDEFEVMQPQQTGGGEPPENPDDETTEPPTEPTEPTEPTDEELKEIPLKSKEQILKDLENAGVDEQADDNGDDDEKPFDIKKDDGKDGKDGKDEIEGGDKPDKPEGVDDKLTKEGKKQQADKLEEEKLQEKIQNLQTKNIITTKINQYNEILANKDNLPNKVKETLNSAIKELEEKRNLIN